MLLSLYRLNLFIEKTIYILDDITNKISKSFTTANHLVSLI